MPGHHRRGIARLAYEAQRLGFLFGGVVTTTQANEAGFSNERLRLLVNSGDLERAAFGVYILPEEFADKMYIAQLRRPRIIYSHDTALFLHGLTDRDPLHYTVTVPTGYKTVKLREEGFQVFTIRKELHTLGTEERTTIFGQIVLAYDLERTICDLLRSRNNMEMQTFQGALKMYARRKDKDLRTLMRYAGMFRVEKILRQYLEVLL